MASASPKVHLPHVLASDLINHTVILEDCGVLPSLKDYVLEAAKVDPDACAITVREVGEILGDFMARLHVWGYALLHPPTQDAPALAPFRDNEAATDAKKLSAWLTAGRLTDMAKRFDKADACDWDALSNQLQEDVLNKDDTFTMGDFW